MATLLQGWGDSPSTGAIQEHVVIDVFRQAVESASFVPYAIPRRVEGGQSFTIPQRQRLSEPTSSTLLETQSIPLDKLTISSKTISMVERGRGVQMTKKAMNRYRSILDLMSEHRMALSEQMRLVIDTITAAAFKAAKVKYVATGLATQNIATGGTAGAAALANVNFYHLRKMRDYLHRTLFAPKLPSGFYQAIFSTAGVRGILDDPEFLEINKFGNREIFSRNDVGRIADIIVAESNHDNALDDDIGTNSDVGEGVVFGSDAVYLGQIDAPSMYIDSDDHDRFRSIAWYGDWGAGTSTDSGSAGLARIMHFTST